MTGQSDVLVLCTLFEYTESVRIWDAGDPLRCHLHVLRRSRSKRKRSGLGNHRTDSDILIKLAFIFHLSVP